MNDEMKANGFALAYEPLQLRQTESTVSTEDVPQTIEELPAKLSAHDIKNATVICWQIHAVTWGKFADGTLTFATDVDPDLVQEIRAFNENFELHLYKDGDRITGRWRFDGEGDDTEYVDSCARLWGERRKAISDIPTGYIELRDTDRQISMIIPSPTAPSKTYGLVTRSYIGVTDDAIPQSSYVDSRFVMIVPEDAVSWKEDA